MQIELLYFKGCPSWKPAAENLKAVLKELCIPDPIQYIEVKNDADVTTHCFIGSPTIRVNGQDIDPAARNLRTYFLVMPE